jgi:hypothetical protein
VRRKQNQARKNSISRYGQRALSLLLSFLLVFMLVPTASFGETPSDTQRDNSANSQTPEENDQGTGTSTSSSGANGQGDDGPPDGNPEGDKRNNPEPNKTEAPPETGGASRSNGIQKENATPAAETYTVTFVLNGSKAEIEPQKLPAGSNAKDPYATTGAPADFEGWFAENEQGTLAETAFDFEKTPITKDLTLVAKFRTTDLEDEASGGGGYSILSAPGSVEGGTGHSLQSNMGTIYIENNHTGGGGQPQDITVNVYVNGTSVSTTTIPRNYRQGSQDNAYTLHGYYEPDGYTFVSATYTYEQYSWIGGTWDWNTQSATIAFGTTAITLTPTTNPQNNRNGHTVNIYLERVIKHTITFTLGGAPAEVAFSDATTGNKSLEVTYGTTWSAVSGKPELTGIPADSYHSGWQTQDGTPIPDAYSVTDDVSVKPIIAQKAPGSLALALPASYSIRRSYHLHDLLQITQQGVGEITYEYSADGGETWVTDWSALPLGSDSNGKEFQVRGSFIPDSSNAANAPYTNEKVHSNELSFTYTYEQKTPSELTVTIADFLSNEEPNPSVTVIAGDGDVTYEYVSAEEYNDDPNNAQWVPASRFDTDTPGDYYVRAKISETEDYDAATSPAASFKILNQSDFAWYRVVFYIDDPNTAIDVHNYLEVGSLYYLAEIGTSVNWDGSTYPNYIAGESATNAAEVESVLNDTTKYNRVTTGTPTPSTVQVTDDNGAVVGVYYNRVVYTVFAAFSNSGTAYRYPDNEHPTMSGTGIGQFKYGYSMSKASYANPRDPSANVYEGYTWSNRPRYALTGFPQYSATTDQQLYILPEIMPAHDIVMFERVLAGTRYVRFQFWRYDPTNGPDPDPSDPVYYDTIDYYPGPDKALTFGGTPAQFGVFLSSFLEMIEDSRAAEIQYGAGLTPNPEAWTTNLSTTQGNPTIVHVYYETQPREVRYILGLPSARFQDSAFTGVELRYPGTTFDAVPGVVVPGGFIFEGWYDYDYAADPAGLEYTAGSTMQSGNMHLYAKWRPVKDIKVVAATRGGGVYKASPYSATVTVKSQSFALDGSGSFR